MSDKAKIRMLLILSAGLFMALAAMAYNFVVLGSTAKSADGRTAILLNAAERDLVLAEMRGFVEVLRDITDALAREDMSAVEKAARSAGMANAGNVPASLIGKLPLEFKQLGFSVHESFDQMALDAKGLGIARHTLEQLSSTLARCAGCHASYRLQADMP